MCIIMLGSVSFRHHPEESLWWINTYMHVDLENQQPSPWLTYKKSFHLLTECWTWYMYLKRSSFNKLVYIISNTLQLESHSEQPNFKMIFKNILKRITQHNIDNIVSDVQKLCQIDKHIICPHLEMLAKLQCNKLSTTLSEQMSKSFS